MDDLAEALAEIADNLYAVPAGEFVTARDTAAKAAGDKALAARVKKLKKPSIAAWALNLLVRREQDQIDQVLALGESLREAAQALDGDELRALTRQRRQLTTALAGTARDLAREHGVRLTQAVVDQVEGMLTAAMLDPAAADVVRGGMVLTAFMSTGVGELDAAAVVAVPEAVGHRVTPAAPPARPELTVVHPDKAILREAAADQVAAAARAVETARTELAVHDEHVGDLEARQLQVQSELDEARRRVADLEDRLDDVDEQLQSATAERLEAADELDAAQRTLKAAEAELRTLE